VFNILRNCQTASQSGCSCPFLAAVHEGSKGTDIFKWQSKATFSTAEEKMLYVMDKDIGEGRTQIQWKVDSEG
ncbi:UNVERIFIED_CONTAM: hypothetical protein KB574_10775, partial [Streptococcus canis]